MGATSHRECIIDGPKDLAEGMAELAARHPNLRAAYGRTGPLPLRRNPEGFAQLLSAIISQQVSVASATAIWARIEAAGLTNPNVCKNATEDALRALGLSRQKARYARALAQAELDYSALRDLPSDQVINTLVEVPGIGPWTAQIYVMFSLGRADVFAPGDLALQEATRLLYALPERPTTARMADIAKDWAPWRAVAARLLWAYYRLMKDKEGIR